MIFSFWLPFLVHCVVARLLVIPVSISCILILKFKEKKTKQSPADSPPALDRQPLATAQGYRRTHYEQVFY
jgi:hypothetical protein